MCGIAGELNFQKSPHPEALRRMAHAIRHRGPDGDGFFEQGPVGLAHRRLAILDLTTGDQPMSRGGCTVVFNGEIYGFARLRDELRSHGHTFTSTSDTEVLLVAYLQWGTDCVRHLDGMFAFALWDERNQRLILARDRAGKKPLYFALETDGGRPREESDALPQGAVRRLAFASELKALVAHGELELRTDRAALVRYLAAEAIPGARSAFAEVRKLPPASLAIVDASGFRVEKYWELPWPETTPFVRGASLDARAAELRVLLEEAVTRRLVADVPVGVFLSGGIDSSSITAFAVESHPGVSTFSIAFEEESFDESPYAAKVAKLFGTDHHVEHLSATACADLVPHAAEILDEPFADASFFPTLLLSRFARQSVKVALGGDGGDEIFAGYDPFLAHQPARVLSAMPTPVLDLLAAGVARLPVQATNMSFEFRAKQLLRGLQGEPALRHASWLAAFSPGELEALVVPELQGYTLPSEIYRDALAGAQADVRAGIKPSSVDEALRYYFHRYLADDILVKADRASMAASLEARSPFLDQAVVEWAARLPWQYKLSLTTTKRILKRALRGVVPDEILDRPKKGFGIPVASWIRGQLRPLFEDLFSESNLAQSGLIQPAPARALLQRHLDGKADLRKPLWTLMMLLLWQRRWGR
jgi:asparagine synthase (glutamine-hydrolysing)